MRCSDLVVAVAVPNGYWLLRSGDADPRNWAWMREESPVAEINRLRSVIDGLETALRASLAAIGAEGDPSTTPDPASDPVAVSGLKTGCL